MPGDESANAFMKPRGETAAGLPMAVAHNLPSISVLAKCLADANRLRILQLIGEGRKSVSAIVEALDLSQPLVSHHLKELRRALLVRVERQGPFVYYEIADERVLAIMAALSALAADLLAGRHTL